VLVVGEPGDAVEKIVGRLALGFFRAGQVVLHDLLPLIEALGRLSAIGRVKALNRLVAQPTELRQRAALAD
jgi:hypothetical protein